MKTVIGASVILLGIVVGPVTAFAQAPDSQVSSQSVALVPIACFSPQRVFSESESGKAVISRVTAFEKDKTQQIDERTKALQTQEQALQQGGAVLSDGARAQRTQELEKFRLDVQRFIEDAQAEVTGVERDAETAFLATLKPAVEHVAREKKLQIVFNLDSGPIVWADPSLDITADIIKQLAAQ